MAAIYQTAYPRIKSDITQDELGDIYTPTPDDQQFALRHCKRTSTSFLGLLVQLKTTQRLGRFVKLSEIPKLIIVHIKTHCRSRATIQDLNAYYASGSKDRHVKLIRRHLNINAYDAAKTSELTQSCAGSGDHQGSAAGYHQCHAGILGQRAIRIARVQRA